jgi:hypothetical protein
MTASPGCSFAETIAETARRLSGRAEVSLMLCWGPVSSTAMAAASTAEGAQANHRAWRPLTAAASRASEASPAAHSSASAGRQKTMYLST